MNQNKKKVQYEALEAWKNNNFRGSIEMVTGTGKTRIGVIGAYEFIKRAIKQYEDCGDPLVLERSLIVTYTEELRDTEWVKEINLWGYGDYISHSDILCIQTAHRFKGRHYNTLIVDEADTVLSPKYMWLFENNTFDRIMLLTAEFSPHHIEILEKLNIPIVFKVDYERALSEELISPFTIINVGIQLLEKEDKIYQQIEEKLKHKTSLLQKVLTDDYPEDAVIDDYLGIIIPKAKIYRLARRYVDEANIKYKSVKYKPLHYWNCQQYLSIISNRKQFIYNSESKVKAVVKICKDIVKDDKCILFSESIAFSESIRDLLDTKQRRCYLFHSKQGIKEKKRELDLFRKSTKGILSSAKALNRGINVPDVNYGIIMSGNSSKREFIQRLGREVRLSNNINKHAILIQPYLMGTQESYWVNNRIGSLSCLWCDIHQLERIIKNK